MLNWNGLTAMAMVLAAAAPVDVTAAEPPASTLVTPHMEAPVAAGQNVVYCATFQVAWNDMKTEIIGEAIRLEKPLDLVERLNRSLTTREDLPAADYVAMVDYGSDRFVNRLNRALRDKFGPDAPQVERKYASEEVIVAYAYMEKNVRFAAPFDVFGKPVTFHSGGRTFAVEGFGVGRFSPERHGTIGHQVEILDYRDAGDFAVRLRSAVPGEEIILARVRPEPTLLQTYEKVERRVEGAVPSYLQEEDILMIPKLAVSIDHSYDELVGLYLRNEGFEEYFVDEARQKINFGFDERGATVDSEAKLVLEKKGPPPGHKRLVFSSSFLLYMKTKGATYPYFAVWVDNDELLIARD